MKPRVLLVALLLTCGSLRDQPVARADEGMWLLNLPPHDLLKKKYQFEFADGWLERAMKASVRFNNGGSGSFVSPSGLVITNHHIGADSLQKLSGKGKDYYHDGFHARTLKDELKCPDLELNVLQGIEDVTAQVQASVKPGMATSEAAAARRAIIAKIEKDSLAKSSLRSDVVTLYQGGLYHLYRYKKYTDVRLVMAPEQGIAFFGGDTDNFEYPRYNLDVCFFRVYEDDKPVQTKHFFKWSATGPHDGDLVFVSGHPGSTNRLETLDRLKHRRDVTLPYWLSKLRYQEALLLQFAEKGAEQARLAAKDLYPVANARKAVTGQYHGLLDPAIIAQKRQQELSMRMELRLAASARQALKETRELYDAFVRAIERIAKSQERLTAFEREYSLLEGGDAFYDRHFRIARHLVRMATELDKPDGERLKEYRSAALDSLKFQLFSPAPISPELERVKLTGSLMFLGQSLGGEHPLVAKILAGTAPEARAAELSAGTKIADPAVRRKLADGGLKAIQSSEDAMVRLAILIDDDARKLRKRFEEEVEEVEQQAYADIAKARFALRGTSTPPDATFTLRLAFGVVKGYDVDNVTVPFTTNFGGAFARETGRDPFALPKRWHDRKPKLDLKTPFNFVSTADTIGGNSGSPVLNRAGELVGINFDRNRHGLVRNYVYTDHQARHISVHSRAVLEALRHVYDADRVLAELTEAK
jgi:hypothetical protein